MEEEDPRRSAVRWVVAFAVMGVLVVVLAALSVDAVLSMFSVEGPPPEAEEDTAAGGVEDGQAQPAGDIGVRAGAVRQAAEGTLEIGGEPGDAVIVSFPLIPGDAECVAAAHLELQLLEGTETELVVHPATVGDVANLADGAALPEELLAEQTPAAAAFTDGTPGRLIWDVTELYRRYADIQGTPAQTAAAAGATGEFSVVVKPTAYDNAERQVVFASTEAGGDQTPLLIWTGSADC